MLDFITLAASFLEQTPHSQTNLPKSVRTSMALFAAALALLCAAGAADSAGEALDRDGVSQKGLSPKGYGWHTYYIYRCGHYDGICICVQASGCTRALRTAGSCVSTRPSLPM